MPSAAEYRAKAEECLRAASEATDTVATSLLRMLADDYFDLAKAASKRQTVAQQQEQIQPKKGDGSPPHSD
jgi:hypothetical protein